MGLSEEELKREWAYFEDGIMWHCPQCDTILSVVEYPKCDGQDPMLPVEEYKPHVAVKATEPITFNQFCEIMNRWFELTPEPKNKGEKSR